MSSESVDFGDGIATRAVAIDDPHLGLGSDEFGAESETGTHAKRAERTRVEPRAGRARVQNVRSRSDEITSIGD